jgi:hypothetical protein
MGNTRNTQEIIFGKSHTWWGNTEIDFLDRGY